MAAMIPEEMLQYGDSLFAGQRHMLHLFQSLSENFYPERADFHFNGQVSIEMADNLADSYPVLCRRDLANSFHAMLRDGNWFNLKAEGVEKNDRDANLWLEWATGRQMDIMNNRDSGFIRTVKEGDHDFATFGQTVLSVEPNRFRNGIVYRNWHLRDCAWEDDEKGQVCTVARKWRPKRFEMIRLFPNTVPERVKLAAAKDPMGREDVMHIVFPSDVLRDPALERFPYVSVFISIPDKVVLEKIGQHHKHYIVPRFQTIAGTPYAYSPATIAALPDGRTLQAMTHTLLEAAERYSNPPVVATQKVVVGPVDLRPNGITWVDNQYDERLGAALRTIGQDKGGFPIGASERGRVYEILNRAFYLDKLYLPMVDKEMTAYEVQERMKQFRRENLPLFAPMETDYNGQLCEATFDLAFRMGLMGSPQDVPESLRGRNVTFKYKSPLTETEEDEKRNQFTQMSMQLREAAELDRGVVDNVDFDVAIRDALVAPQKWIVPLETVRERRQQDAQIMAAREAAAAAGAQAA